VKILHAPHAYAPVRGGAELQCQRVGEELVKRGLDVQVLTTNVGSVEAYYRFGIPPVRAVERERLHGVDVVRMDFGGWVYAHAGRLVEAVPWRGVRARSTAYLRQRIRRQFFCRLDRAIRQYSPDVVIALPHLVVNVLAVLAAHRTQQFPLVMLPMLHEESPDWDLDAMKQALTQADAVMANTRFEQHRLEHAYDVPKERIFLGGSGVDLPSSRTDRRPSATVLFLGRKAASKGIPLLIDAMRRVWMSRPDVQLCIAGARTADTPVIEAQVADLPGPMRSRVRMPENMSEADKLALLGSAACLVLPSKVESLGIVLLEAWASQVPVVTLDLPVFRSTVTPGRDGLLAKPDPTDLAGAILRLLNHPHEAAAMGQVGYDKVVEHYAWEKVAARYEQAYRYAAEHPRGRAARARGLSRAPI